MLFEQESLTPKGRLTVLSRLFCEVARSSGESLPAGHVPLPVLKAHGDFEMHLRYLLDAAEKLCRDKERLRAFRKARHLLDSLPELMMHTFSAGPDADWLRFYRNLVRLHDLLEVAEPTMETQEYAAIVRKMAALVGAVADASAVRIDGASMFTLMLMQVLLRRYSPKYRRRASRRRKRKK